MKRLALTVAALAIFAVPASAATCDKDYRDFWDKMSAGPAKKLSAADYAQLSRTALRGYDSCTAGDERFSAKDFWKKLEQAGPGKAQDIFKQIEQSGPAKK